MYIIDGNKDLYFKPKPLFSFSFEHNITTMQPQQQQQNRLSHGYTFKIVPPGDKLGLELDRLFGVTQSKRYTVHNLGPNRALLYLTERYNCLMWMKAEVVGGVEDENTLPVLFAAEMAKIRRSRVRTAEIFRGRLRWTLSAVGK
ncbi:CUN093 hypothetical protein [Culex nigripalpus nucleopolyhedrovirus]|uniref:Uncharacterized protein n=1 Tax=Culex nigripalpus nucleopolyhedrovirus (isolate Florida/1997) TaxID=645993 RepID=Q919I4_NPVCO|nr:CUN093 hypothetical protein [Culex nigripalpus nucleopolyhedrovirus]AAK94171.1 CUN093 hypothetical protein [Culex nigripalpus nucleopolyhedrovirus]